MYFSSATLRRFGFGGLVAALCLFTAVPGQAQTLRQQMAMKLAGDAGNMMVSKINGASCAQFGQMMAQVKNNKSSSTSSHLKNNSAARQKFVNIVAGPMMNKMIDCDMLPGGM